jgi:hypothetical protein
VLKQQAATTGSARLRNQLKDMEASVDDVDKAEGSAEERKIFIKSKKASSYKTQK